MIFAEFYTRGLVSGELITACGDRSVIILDGRYSLEKNIDIAAYWCKQRNYNAFTIGKGDSFTQSKKLTGIIKVIL